MVPLPVIFTFHRVIYKCNCLLVLYRVLKLAKLQDNMQEKCLRERVLDVVTFNYICSLMKVFLIFSFTTDTLGYKDIEVTSFMNL